MVRMTSNSSPIPYVASASSEDVGAQDYAYRAFDNDINFLWESSPSETSPPAWLALDFGAGRARILRRYSIRCAGFAFPKRFPNSWRMEASNDLTQPWKIVATVSGFSSWPSNFVLFNYDFNDLTKTTKYRYVRIFVTVNNGAGPDGDFHIVAITDFNPDAAGVASLVY